VRVWRTDRTEITLTQDLADDTPSADPRWEIVRQKFSVGSYLIVQQLREKSLAMFLQATLIWDKVTNLMRKLNEQNLLNSFCFPAPRGH
jgi:hypothetical protein